MSLIYFDFFLIAQMLLMDVLRLPVILAIFNVLSLQFEANQITIFSEKSNAEYLLQFDCRRIYFEHFLNDKHDDFLRRIFIRDVVESRITYLYNRSENGANVFLFNRSENETPPYLYNRNEIAGLLDFEVVLPIGLVYNLDELKSYIERFRLPGMKYQIVEE